MVCNNYAFISKPIIIERVQVVHTATASIKKDGVKSGPAKEKRRQWTALDGYFCRVRPESPSIGVLIRG